MHLAAIVCAVVAALVCAVGPCLSAKMDTNGSKNTVYQLNGKANAIELPREYQLASKDWPKPAQVPYLVYMPEKDRLAMLVIYGNPAISFSDDHGATWSVPKEIPGAGRTLSYLGNGTLLSDFMVSHDYGETWEALPKQSEREVWLPPLVDKDPKTGKVTRLAKTFWSPLREWGHGKKGPYSQGYISFSYDEGRTWVDEIKVPQWFKVSEVALSRAKNGNIVAACRLDNPKLFDGVDCDNYSGTGVSISKDNGKTWSDPFDPKMILFDWGRNHMFLETMPGGEIVMSYIVRRGYADDASGFPQFGIEAVVSRDNGKTWDLDHRCILHVYSGGEPATDFRAAYASPYNASTVVLPDGALLTAFNMEYSKIGLVKWRLNDKGLNKDRTYSNAPHDSFLRNEFDPAILTGKQAQPTGRRNLATARLGATVLATRSDIEPLLALENPYLYAQHPPGVVFESAPAIIEIRLPGIRRIDEVRILSGDAYATPGEDLSRVPLDYQLEYYSAGKWTRLTEPVVNAEGRVAFIWRDELRQPYRTYQFLHLFDPVRADRVRLTITRATNSPTGRVFLKRIEVWGE